MYEDHDIDRMATYSYSEVVLRVNYVVCCS